MSHTAAAPVASGTNTPKPKGKKGIILMIFFGLLFIAIIKWLFFSNSSSNSEKNATEFAVNNDTVKVKPVGLVGTITEVKTITFDSAYSAEPFHVSDGFNFSLFDATEPYCLKNENIEECGNRGEDLSQKLKEKDPANRRLWFKSTSGKPGKVKILLISRN